MNIFNDPEGIDWIVILYAGAIILTSSLACGMVLLGVCQILGVLK